MKKRRLPYLHDPHGMPDNQESNLARLVTSAPFARYCGGYLLTSPDAASVDSASLVTRSPARSG